MEPEKKKKLYYITLLLLFLAGVILFIVGVCLENDGTIEGYSAAALGISTGLLLTVPITLFYSYSPDMSSKRKKGEKKHLEFETKQTILHTATFFSFLIGGVWIYFVISAELEGFFCLLGWIPFIILGLVLLPFCFTYKDKKKIKKEEEYNAKRSEIYHDSDYWMDIIMEKLDRPAMDENGQYKGLYDCIKKIYKEFGFKCDSEKSKITDREQQHLYDDSKTFGKAALYFENCCEWNRLLDYDLTYIESKRSIYHKQLSKIENIIDKSKVRVRWNGDETYYLKNAYKMELIPECKDEDVAELHDTYIKWRNGSLDEDYLDYEDYLDDDDADPNIEMPIVFNIKLLPKFPPASLYNRNRTVKQLLFANGKSELTDDNIIKKYMFKSCDVNEIPAEDYRDRAYLKQHYRPNRYALPAIRLLALYLHEADPFASYLYIGNFSGNRDVWATHLVDTNKMFEIMAKKDGKPIEFYSEFIQGVNERKEYLSEKIKNKK